MSTRWHISGTNSNGAQYRGRLFDWNPCFLDPLRDEVQRRQDIDAEFGQQTARFAIVGDDTETPVKGDRSGHRFAIVQNKRQVKKRLGFGFTRIVDERQEIAGNEIVSDDRFPDSPI